MRTRTEAEMLALILGFAEEDERIRVVLLNGSRVNPTISPDPFQDYDVACFVTEVQPFRDADYVLPRFGEAIIVQTPEDMGWPPPRGGDLYVYLIQLLDGNRVDLSFCPVDSLEAELADSLTAVLLDKDGVVPEIPVASERSYLLQQPTARFYADCCNEFYLGLGSHVPKTLWRRRLLLARFYLRVVLREPLLQMMGWEVGIRHGFNRSIGKASWRLQELLPAETWARYERTYAESDWGDIWDAVLLLDELFKASAEFVAGSQGYQFPAEEARRTLVFLRHVRQLPEDATTIY